MSDMNKSNTNQHKLMAAGKPVTGMKEGGSVPCPPKAPKKPTKKGK
jgi:hypothetical protein